MRWVLPSRSLAQARSGFGVDARAGARDDPRGRRLAPALGGHAGDRRLGDVGVLAQHRLEVARVEVEAAADDHVLAAIDEREEAVVVEAADVAGADEPLAGGVEPLGLGGLRRLAVVAGHHSRRVADDFAGRAARQLAAGLVDEADVVALGGLADGVQLVRMLVRGEDAGAAALGHAVELDQAAGPARDDVGLERGGERRAGAELHAERRQVVRAEARARHQPLVLHRHQHRVGDAVALGEREVAVDVELLHQHDRAAEGDGREEDDQRRVRVERRRQQRHRLARVAEAAAAHRRASSACRAAGRCPSACRSSPTNR